MSSSLLAPDLRRILDDLARRIGILERRTTRTAPPAAPLPNHGHDGSGANSVLLRPSTDTTAAASAHDTVAAGHNAQAVAVYGIAIGDNSLAGAASAAAIGDGATANNIASVAIGSAATTDHDHQIMLGTVSEIVEIPKAGGLVLTDGSGGRWAVSVSTGGVLSTAPA